MDSLLRKKRAAVELSVSTIVVIVLAVSMLILGMVLVRSIMCGALGLTSDINSKTRSELDRLFETTSGEIVCIGSGSDPVKVVPGEENIVACQIKAEEAGKYRFELKEYGTSISSLKKETLGSWIDVSSTKYEVTVAPGDNEPKKVLRIKIPDSAPEGNIRFQYEVYKNDLLISTQEIDLEVSRVGFVRGAVC